MQITPLIVEMAKAKGFRCAMLRSTDYNVPLCERFVHPNVDGEIMLVNAQGERFTQRRVVQMVNASNPALAAASPNRAPTVHPSTIQARAHHRAHTHLLRAKLHGMLYREVRFATADQASVYGERLRALGYDVEIVSTLTLPLARQHGDALAAA